MTKSSDPEGVAKNYQIDNLRDDISTVLKAVEKMSNKIDTQLVTDKQLESALALFRKDYEPMKKNLAKITWIVIGVIIPLVVVSGIQLLANLKV